MWKRFLLTWGLVIVVAMSVVGCGAPVASVAEEVAAPVATATEVPSLPVDLSAEMVQALLAEEEIVVLDVRQPSEYEAGHIPGALLVPVGELEGRLDEIPEDERVVTVCRSGNRSGRAQQILADEGFDDVHNMLGGMIAWEAAGFDVER